MADLVERLRKLGLIKKGAPDREAIVRLPATKILDLGKELAQPDPAQANPPISGQLTHAAAPSLAGGRDDCAALECRSLRLMHLARFAALYSDKVYIRNFFHDYEHLENITEPILRNGLFDDVSLVLAVSPLLDAGLMQFENTYEHICMNCLAEALGHGKHAGSKLKRAFSNLTGAFLRNSQSRLERFEDLYILQTEGPQPYFDHSMNHFREDLPSPIMRRPLLVKRLERDGVLSLSPSVVREMHIPDRCAATVGANITFGALLAQEKKASFVTNRDIHVMFLQQATGKPAEIRANTLVQKHMTSLVPFIEDIPLSDLVRMRLAEADSFAQFNAALRNSMQEYHSRIASFTEQDARDIYSDVIRPELAKLENTVETARKKIRRQVGASVAGIVASIGFGLLSGLIPPAFAEIAQAAGLVKFAGDTVSNIAALRGTEDTIRSEDFYFLWKVRHIARLPRTRQNGSAQQLAAADPAGVRKVGE